MKNILVLFFGLLLFVALPKDIPIGIQDYADHPEQLQAVDAVLLVSDQISLESLIMLEAGEVLTIGYTEAEAPGVLFLQEAIIENAEQDVARNDQYKQMTYLDVNFGKIARGTDHRKNLFWCRC